MRTFKGLGILLGTGLALSACSQGAKEPAKSTPATAESAAAGAEKTAETPKAAKTTSKATKAEKLTPKATGPIAKVNGTELARGEFDSKYSKMTRAFTTRKKDIPEGLARRYKESILKQLIDRELLRQAIKAQGVVVAAAELEQGLTDYKKMFRTEENFQRYLKSSNVTLEQIRGNIEHNAAVTKLLEKQGDLKIADAEVQKYYEENSKRYEVKEQVRASHILFKVKNKADTKEDAAAKAKAVAVAKEAGKKGADFAELAKKQSEGPTAPKGGDLSFFVRGRMVPAFDKVAFKLKVGEISDPIRTQFGWHVIKVTDKKEGRKRPFDEVKESIGKLLRNKKSRKAKNELLKKLKKEAKVETFLPELKATGKTLKPLKANPLKPAPKSATPAKK